MSKSNLRAMNVHGTAKKRQQTILIYRGFAKYSCSLNTFASAHGATYIASEMTPATATLRNISDTALWAALYRARETERPDALFRDPLARRLAGERGEAIAAAMPFSDRNTWSWVTRTWLYDHLIIEQIRQGVDMVVNLAA